MRSKVQLDTFAEKFRRRNPFKQRSQVMLRQKDQFNYYEPIPAKKVKIEEEKKRKKKKTPRSPEDVNRLKAGKRAIKTIFLKRQCQPINEELIWGKKDVSINASPIPSPRQIDHQKTSISIPIVVDSLPSSP